MYTLNRAPASLDVYKYRNNQNRRSTLSITTRDNFKGNVLFLRKKNIEAHPTAYFKIY